MCSTSGSSGGGGAGSRRGHRRALCGRLRHDTGDADAERFGLEPPFWTAQFDFNPQARKDSCCSRCRQPLRRSVATGSSTSCPRVALCAFVASLWRALNGAGARHRQQPRVRLGPPARVRSLPVWQLLLLSPPAHPPCRDAVAGCVWHRRGLHSRRPRRGPQRCARPRPIAPAAPRPRAPRIQRPRVGRSEEAAAQVSTPEQGHVKGKQASGQPPRLPAAPTCSASSPGPEERWPTIRRSGKR